jgi:Holliday junction DNA helicase RuvA
MIGKLTGTIDCVEKDSIILDVMGVGYAIYLLNSTMMNLRSGQSASFFIEMQVRDEQSYLYGFANLEQKRCFKLLQTVQGVGAKAAMVILDQLGIDGIFTAIASKDTLAFKAVPGIGPKIAKRILTELGDKIMSPGISSSSEMGTSVGGGYSDTIQQAMLALESLGFQRSHIFTKVLENANNDISLEDLISITLKQMGT